MFEIRNEYGDLYRYSPRSYDMACRVAYCLRKLSGIGIMVVSSETGRAISEVFNLDPGKDRYAMKVARRIS